MTYNGSRLSWATSASYGGYNICNLFSNQTVPAFPEATYTVVIEDLDRRHDHQRHLPHPQLRHGRRVHPARIARYPGAKLRARSDGSPTPRTASGSSPATKLSGLIWTNGQFNIDGNPIFNGPVYSGSGSINYMNGGPPAIIRRSPTALPTTRGTSTSARCSAAARSPRSRTSPTAAEFPKPSNSGNGYTLTFNTGGTFTLVKNGGGSGSSAVSPVTLYNNAPISTINGAFYFQDTVQVSGTIDGQVTVATSSGKDIDITGNLVYSYPANPATMFDAGFNQSDPLLTSKCALISGGNVVIDQTWSGAWTDMYITAICASVTGSFENQYYTSSPQKTLHLYGGITQMTRGAVGTTSGTGFLKDYLYDTRFTDVAAAVSAAGRRPVQQLAALLIEQSVSHATARRAGWKSR